MTRRGVAGKRHPEATSGEHVRTRAPRGEGMHGVSEPCRECGRAITARDGGRGAYCGRCLERRLEVLSDLIANGLLWHCPLCGAVGKGGEVPEHGCDRRYADA